MADIELEKIDESGADRPSEEEIGKYTYSCRRDPGAELTYIKKCKLLREAMYYMREAIPFESACFAANLTPDEVQGWMQEDLRVNLMVRRQIALAEVALIRELKKGGPGHAKSKAALNILQGIFKAWTPKTSVTLMVSFQSALDELEQKLEPEVYELVLRTFQRHEK